MEAAIRWARFCIFLHKRGLQMDKSEKKELGN